jgi:hypothetical protein
MDGQHVRDVLTYGGRSILYFVTIKGRPTFALPTRIYSGHYDPYFADFLNEEYNRIITGTSWLGCRCLHFKTIGAVEFQTVRQNQFPPFSSMLMVKKLKWTLKGNSWKLSEVDSIPNTATRTNMSHFSYQLRHTDEKGRRWARKVEDLLIKARDVHTKPRNGQAWNFRIHIIEIIDARCVQPLERTSALISSCIA